MDTQAQPDKVAKVGYDFFYHGVYMWLAWTLFAVVQVASNRYLKGTLQGIHMWIHRLIGTSMMLMTLYHGYSAWKTLNWKVVPNTHSIFVFPVLFSVFFIAIGGVATRSMLRRSVWNTAKALSIKKAHKICAYILIGFGTGAIMAGIHSYRTNDKHIFETPYEWLHFLLTVLVFGVLETIYRRSQKVDVTL